ncbi:acyl carrier protein, partial [Niastella populi]|uniref:acyl carrier protein n=1 Tax=Niastella populi TaxID=550983 RepID=UPI0010550815
VKDNFFEIGGNSLKIVMLAKQISKALEREINLTLLFQYPSINDLVNYLQREEPVHQEEDFDRNEMMHDLNKFNYE